MKKTNKKYGGYDKNLQSIIINEIHTSTLNHLHNYQTKANNNRHYFMPTNLARVRSSPNKSYSTSEYTYYVARITTVHIR